MLRKIKLLLIALPMLGLIALPVTVSASSITGALTCGTDLSASQSGCTNPSVTANSSIANIVDTVITFFSWIVGSVSVIMIIYGGFRYVTSGGNDSSVSGAKNTIVYALIGLVIVALAQIIVHFVLSKAINAGNTATGTGTGGILYSTRHLLF